MGSCREHGMVGDDPVIALSVIIGAVGKTRSAQSCNFCLKNLDIGWIGGCAARTGSKGTRIDGFLLFRIVDYPFRPNAEECSQIGLIQVNHT